MLVARVIVPVPALIFSPAVDEYVPPAVPVNVGVGFVPFAQKGDPV